MKKLNKYYLYEYSYESTKMPFYYGQGSDGLKKGKARFKRANDINGHGYISKLITEGIIDEDDIVITILNGFDRHREVTLAEARSIKIVGLKNLENRREELSDSKYRDALEIEIFRQYGLIDIKMDVEKIIESNMDASYGADSAEPLSISNILIETLNKIRKIKENDNILIVGNDQFGGLNILEVAVDYLETNNVSADIMFIGKGKIGAIAYLSKKALKYGVKYMEKDFLEYDFGEEHFDLTIMNPPFAKVGKPMIEKASELSDSVAFIMSESWASSTQKTFNKFLPNLVKLIEINGEEFNVLPKIHLGFVDNRKITSSYEFVTESKKTIKVDKSLKICPLYLDKMDIEEFSLLFGKEGFKTICGSSNAKRTYTGVFFENDGFEYRENYKIPATKKGTICRSTLTVVDEKDSKYVINTLTNLYKRGIINRYLGDNTVCYIEPLNPEVK